jgi:hypothetical protein
VPRRSILALFCCAYLGAQQSATRFGITAQYGADFTGHEWKQAEKLTQQQIGTDIPEGVAPLRAMLQLKGRVPGRADENAIQATPLRDRSVPDFAKAYPGLSAAAKALRALLATPQLPRMKALEKADPETVDAAYSLCARVERVDSPWLSGFAFLLQTSQEEGGDLPNNGELAYRFLGITKDGSYLVDATFSVNHPSLPKKPVYTTVQKLRAGEKQLDSLGEDTFQPPLSHLKAVIRSLAAAR